MRLEILSLSDIADAAVGPFRLAAAESGSGTKFLIETALDAPLVRGDAVQIGQVFEHLLDNAAKYAAGGDVRVTIRRDGGLARVDVCDSGSGIRPEEVERVFMPFGRGQAGAGREGYGLGLFLARNIISAHGGRLWIARTSRSGTCMAIQLPATEEDDTL